MRTANKRKLNRLIRECFEEGNVNIEPSNNGTADYGRDYRYHNANGRCS